MSNILNLLVSSIQGLGTGVATALGINVGSAGSVVVNGGALGTPSSGVATNLTTATASAVSNSTAIASVAYADRLVRAWAIVTYSGATPTLAAGYNVSSVSAVTTGKLAINFSATFTSAASYGCVASAQNSASNNATTVPVPQTGAQLQIWHYENGDTLTDPAVIFAICFGS